MNGTTKLTDALKTLDKYGNQIKAHTHQGNKVTQQQQRSQLQSQSQSQSHLLFQSQQSASLSSVAVQTKCSNGQVANQLQDDAGSRYHQPMHTTILDQHNHSDGQVCAKDEGQIEGPVQYEHEMHELTSASGHYLELTDLNSTQTTARGTVICEGHDSQVAQTRHHGQQYQHVYCQPTQSSDTKHGDLHLVASSSSPSSTSSASPLTLLTPSSSSSSSSPLVGSQRNGAGQAAVSTSMAGGLCERAKQSDTNLDSKLIAANELQLAKLTRQEPTTTSYYQ